MMSDRMIRVDDEVYAALLKICHQVEKQEGKRCSMSRAVEVAIADGYLIERAIKSGNRPTSHKEDVDGRPGR